jgi:hypothetical protein
MISQHWRRSQQRRNSPVNPLQPQQGGVAAKGNVGANAMHVERRAIVPVIVVL